jgi:2-dehydropantoate 2-reductase
VAEAPKIAIFGAGSVGCWIGGAWAAAGLPVTLIGRERIGAEIAEHGLTATDYKDGRIRLPADQVHFSTRPQDLRTADAIVLCVKSTDTTSAAKEIGRFGRKGATVISFQNGVSNADTLRGLLPRFHVVQGMVPFNVAHMGRGRWHKGVQGDLIAEGTPVTERISALTAGTPAHLLLARDMKPIAWGKLLFNLNNAVNALSGKTLLEQLSIRDYRRVLAASMVETLDVLKAARIEPAKLGPIPPALLPHAIGAPDWVFRNLLLRVMKIDASARSSMADDFAAGRRTEIDYLNGEVVRLAESLGRKAPVNRSIVELVKQYEEGVERIWSPEELKRHVLEGHRMVAMFGY